MITIEKIHHVKSTKDFYVVMPDFCIFEILNSSDNPVKFTFNTLTKLLTIMSWLPVDNYYRIRYHSSEVNMMHNKLKGLLDI